MKGVRIKVSGNWAQFRRSETNNNPLSHDFMTKTALIGMIGAVIGKSRQEMKELYPLLSVDFLYGLKLNSEVVKQSWGFTFRSANNFFEKSPKQIELLRNPNYEIILCLKNNRSLEVFDKFVENVHKSKSCYEPVLGLHNCPARVEFIETGEIDYYTDGSFETEGFITNNHKPEEINVSEFRIGFDKVPTYQNNDFWNIPENFVSVIYPSKGSKIKIRGDYYCFNKSSKWCLI